jgi:hypothetical protein
LRAVRQWIRQRESGEAQGWRRIRDIRVAAWSARSRSDVPDVEVRVLQRDDGCSSPEPDTRLAETVTSNAVHSTVSARVAEDRAGTLGTGGRLKVGSHHKTTVQKFIVLTT